MGAAPARNDRPRTPGEEIANSVCHGVGLLAALVAVPFLLAEVARRGGVAPLVGAGVFGAAVILLYLASTLYHALPEGRAKRRLEVLDNAAIFLLIAGTYTPFTLGVLRGAWGWALLGVVWALAVAGVVLTVVVGVRNPVLSACFYLGMGWLVLIAIRPLWLRMPLPGLLLLLGGGLAYTVGVAFYAARRLRYGHLAWHVLVVIGTACHLLAVLWYAA